MSLALNPIAITPEVPDPIRTIIETPRRADSDEYGVDMNDGSGEDPRFTIVSVIRSFGGYARYRELVDIPVTLRSRIQHVFERYHTHPQGASG